MIVDNKNLLQIIKQIAKEERENSMPCDLIFGTVESVTPLQVRISSKITLDRDFLNVLSGVYIENGDKVAILRGQGGQQFLLLGKVV